MIYLDTSSLLKLLLPEPESVAVQKSILLEDQVIISSLAELETEVQLRGGWLGGDFTRSQYRRLQSQLHALGQLEPFEMRTLPAMVIQTALKLHRAQERPHVRVLDRLHLAAMEELGIRRLMTHDIAQANAARALVMTVISPC